MKSLRCWQGTFNTCVSLPNVGSGSVIVLGTSVLWSRVVFRTYGYVRRINVRVGVLKTWSDGVVGRGVPFTGLLVRVIVSSLVSPGRRPSLWKKVGEGRSPLFTSLSYPQGLSLRRYESSTLGRGSCLGVIVKFLSWPTMAGCPLPLLVTLTVLVSCRVTEVPLSHTDGVSIGVRAPPHVKPKWGKYVFCVPFLWLTRSLCSTDRSRQQVVRKEVSLASRSTVVRTPLIIVTLSQ